MIKKNIFSITTALIILFLSLARAQMFNKIPVPHFPGIDKMVHFCMYFGFTSVILLENRNRITKAVDIFLIVIVPFIFGAIMEILQSTLTTTRFGSIFDLLFNMLGILFSLLLFLLIKNSGKENVR